jgi:glycine/D-amino acid oxidase-like deaminating enzyme
VSATHVAVIGAGIVGLSVAYSLTKAGALVTVIDRDPDGDKCSYGNAGGIAVTEVVPASSPRVWSQVLGWMADPLGPLAVRPTHAPKLLPWLVRFAKSGTPLEAARISYALAALNARVYEDLIPMLRDVGSSDELQRRGALSVYETEDGFRRDSAEWVLKRTHGIVAEELTGAQARQLEPALGPNVCRAVFTPQWSHVSDPKHLVQGLKAWLMKQGVTIRAGEVRHILTHSASSLSMRVDGGAPIRADQVVIAAGAWSGILARRLGDRALLESERGYNATLPTPGVTVEREVIFAERKFVATPLRCGLRIGGAAEFGGLNAAANFKRSQALVELARRYLPDLKTEGATNWAGHRPTTPDSLPVIGRSGRHPNVYYAFGHGHLGLTQAATTGRLIAELILDRHPSIDMLPYRIDRFS